MTTPRKPLPRRAAGAVEEAALLLQAATKALGPLLNERPITREEIQIRASRTLNYIKDAQRWLETDGGAPTRPETGRRLNGPDEEQARG